MAEAAGELASTARPRICTCEVCGPTAALMVAAASKPKREANSATRYWRKAGRASQGEARPASAFAQASIQPSFGRIPPVCRPRAIDLKVAVAKDELFRKRRTEHQNDTGNSVPRVVGMPTSASER